MGHRSLTSLCAVLLLCITASGCFTSRYTIPPEHTAASYEIVRSFEVKKRSSWLLFGLVPISEAQVEEIVQNEVQRYNGDAATNVVVTAQYDAVDVVIGALVGGLFNTRSYTVNGDVVRIRGTQGSLAPDAQPNHLTQHEQKLDSPILGGIDYRWTVAK